MIEGPDAGGDAALAGERLVIGRDADCDLVLTDPKVSRRHAFLHALPGGAAALNELQARNGIWVDERRVASEVLRGGERLRVGDSLIEVIAADVPSPPSPPSRRRALSAGASVLSALRGRPNPSQSVLERALLRRSVRRATALAAVSVGGLVVLGGLFLTGVLGGGPSTAERVERVVAETAPSTVLVQSQRGDRRVDNGTGWVLDAGAGLIVTNAHVVNSGTSFSVGVGDTLRRASVVGVAPCEDLAVLRVSDPRGLRSLPLGRQADLRLGETVVAVGFPGNASLSDALTSTAGVVSVARSSYREPALDVPAYPNVVQTDAAINPGNSGGPLVDLDGRLVGVNSAGRTLSAQGRLIQGQSYAIGVDRVRPVVARLRTGRSSAWLGLSLQYLPASELRRRGLPAGLLARGAVRGSPADRAGLGSRPLLITAVDGVPVANSLLSYCDAASAARSGRPVRLSAIDVSRRRPTTLRLAWG